MKISKSCCCWTSSCAVWVQEHLPEIIKMQQKNLLQNNFNNGGRGVVCNIHTYLNRIEKDYRKDVFSCDLPTMPRPWLGDHCQQSSTFQHTLTRVSKFIVKLDSLSKNIDTISIQKVWFISSYTIFIITLYVPNEIFLGESRCRRRCPCRTELQHWVLAFSTFKCDRVGQMHAGLFKFKFKF